MNQRLSSCVAHRVAQDTAGRNQKTAELAIFLLITFCDFSFEVFENFFFHFFERFAAHRDRCSVLVSECVESADHIYGIVLFGRCKCCVDESYIIGVFKQEEGKLCFWRVANQFIDNIFEVMLVCP